MSNFTIANVLTIAGSDSGGGAGIQADIKAISATGSYACSVLTALTAQNTQGVQAILALEPQFIAAQLDAVFTDIKIDAVKIGMLNDRQVIAVIAEKLQQYQPKVVVLDPVMVATSGDALIEEDAIADLIEQLFPLVDVITPNLPEAALLIGQPLAQENDIGQFIQLLQRHPSLQQVKILLKGGHFAGDVSRDWLIDGKKVTQFSHPRLNSNNTHGTGCTLSSALASYLAQQLPLIDAITAAKAYLTRAIEMADSLNVGQGHGPVHHMHPLCSNELSSFAGNSQNIDVESLLLTTYEC